MGNGWGEEANGKWGVGWGWDVKSVIRATFKASRKVGVNVECDLCTRGSWVSPLPPALSLNRYLMVHYH